MDNLINPAVIQHKLDTPEGQVFKVEIEQLGRWVADAEYKLNKLKIQSTHKQLRMKEFLGYTLTDEEKQYVADAEERLEAWSKE